MVGEVTLVADAVLFDSDGVLVDSHAQVETCWSTLAREVGIDFEEIEAVYTGVPSRQTLARWLSGDDLDRACERLEDLEVAAAVRTKPMSGASDLVGSLPPGRFAFATSASARLALARWAGAGITPPPHVVTADDVTVGKPDPAPFVAAAGLLGVEPHRCIVFEDSDAGGRAAEAAGATVVAVGSLPWTVTPAARIPDLRSVTIRGRDPRPGDHHLTVSIGPPAHPSIDRT